MYEVADPHLQLSGGGGGGGRFGVVIQNLRWGDGLKNNFFRPFGPQFGLKTGGPRTPGSTSVYVSKTFGFHLSIAVPLCIIHTSQYVLAMRDRATSTK